MNTKTTAQIMETIPEITELFPQATETASHIAETIQQASIINIDWNEIVYILVGAIIGFLGSIIVLIVERILDKKGKIQIFYRRTSQRGMNGRGWGFDAGTDGSLHFTVPIVFEMQNTSNTTRVIRDVSLMLYSGNRFLGKMYQMQGKHITSRKNGVITGEKDYEFGSEKGSYSFVLPPRSIQRQECEYTFSIQPYEKNEMQFDNVIAKYYDEKNKAHTFKIMTIANSWVLKNFDSDEDWYMLSNPISMPKEKKLNTIIDIK